MAIKNAGIGSPFATDVVLRAIRKRYLAGIAVVIVVILASVFYTIGQKRIFRATATVLIDPSPPRPLGNQVQTIVDMGAGAFWSNKEYYATQHKILQGRAIASETARQLGLNADAAFLTNAPTGVRSAPLRQTVSLDTAAAVVISRLKVEPLRDSRLVIVSFDDANPERARKILAALLEVYLQRNVDYAVSSTSSATEWLQSQLGKLKEELEKSELALHDYKKDNRILSVSIDDQSNMLRGEMTQLNEALTRINARREELKARVEQLEKVDPEHPTQLPSTELLASSVLQSLRQDYVKAQSEYEELLGSGKGENHPSVEAMSPRVEMTRLALMNEVRNVQGALRNEFASVSQEASGIDKLFERAKQRALDLNMLEIEYRRLERTKNNTEKLYGLVLERSKESELTGLMRFNNIRISEEPIALPGAVLPKVPLNLGLGASLGLVLGLGLIVSWELLDRKLRTPDDIEMDLGVPVLGALQTVTSQTSMRGPYYGRRRGHKKNTPDAGDRSVPELVAHTAPTSSIAESARGIRTSLTFASPDKEQHVVLVTSASPGEGKTMMASTIAIVFAQAGHKTILIDCDLRRSRLHRVFQHSNDIGVSSSMQDHELLDSSTLQTIVPNLSLLPAGPRVANPAELLQSQKFAQLLAELRKRYDRIVIDSPPITAVTDAVIISTISDATALVVRAGKTQRQVAAGAIRSLTDVAAPLMGCVLNCLEPKRKGRGYYYYRYYHDSEYAGTAKA